MHSNMNVKVAGSLLSISNIPPIADWRH